MERLTERFTQSDGKKVDWPHLESAEKLTALSDKEYKTLFVYEARRKNNMPPPAIRQICDYMGGESTSVVKGRIKKLAGNGYLHQEEYNSTRSTTIKVNFDTVKRISGSGISLHDMPGVTSPVENK